MQDNLKKKTEIIVFWIVIPCSHCSLQLNPEDGSRLFFKIMAANFKHAWCYNPQDQGSTRFKKFGELPQNSSAGCVTWRKFHTYSTQNMKCHRTKFSCSGNPVRRICTPMRKTIFWTHRSENFKSYRKEYKPILVHNKPQQDRHTGRSKAPCILKPRQYVGSKRLTNSSPGRFTPRKEHPCPLDSKMGGPGGRSGRGE
jgi:hypothetical protein